MESDPVSVHLAAIIEKASPIAVKTAIGTSVTTVAAPQIWTLQETAIIVGMVCSIATATAAIVLGVLNYMINKKRGGKQ